MLPEIAARRLRQLRANQPQTFTESLIDYIPRVTPRWSKPVWLLPLVEILERAASEPLRVVVAAPPQHGKTESVIHSLCYALRKAPGRRHAYATYAQQRAERISEKAKLVAHRDGQQLKWRQEYWVDPVAGSSVLWASRGGPFTGEPVDGLLVIDDPLKDREEAESPTIRQKVIDWFDDVAEPRCHMTASIVVIATRWHKDDLSGVLIRRGWNYVNLRALAEPRDTYDVDDSGRVISDPLRRMAGEPLCAERQSKEILEQRRKVNPYGFASLYQGEPRPREGAIFKEPTYYTELPDKGFRVGYGVDLAYSAKKKSDWSVVIRMISTTETTGDGKTRKLFYVADVVRKQVDAPSFLLTLKARHTEMRGPMLWIASGTEKGAAQFIQQRVPLEVRNASEDKIQRSLGAAEAWNDGRLMIPQLEEGDPRKEWCDCFLDELLNFSGKGDANDDQVDALAAAHELMSGPRYGGGDLADATGAF